MITSKFLGSTAIWQFCWWHPSIHKRAPIFNPRWHVKPPMWRSLVPCLTRSHSVQGIITAAFYLFFNLHTCFYLNLLSHRCPSKSHSFRGLPISHYRKRNSWWHVNTFHLSVYKSAFPVRLLGLHSWVSEDTAERQNNTIIDTLKYHNVNLHFTILW